MKYRLEISERAYDDLQERYLWIRAHAGEAVADAYDARIRARIETLRDFPLRGTPHDDLRIGVRSIPFERRLILYYAVAGNQIEILRIVDGVRDQRTLFDA